MGFPAVFLTLLAVIAPGVVMAAEATSEHSGKPASVLGAWGAKEPVRQHVAPARRQLPSMQVQPGGVFRELAESFRASSAQQVRIEQRMSIRIIPRPSTLQPNTFLDLPEEGVGPKYRERKIGKCLPISRILGVQPDKGRRLILFMRDQRVIIGRLERACRARDFYSGFYLANSQDGKLCVDRDTLLSRSGANCTLTRIRQLVETGN